MKLLFENWREYLKEEKYTPKGQYMDFPAEYLKSHKGEYSTEPHWKNFFKKTPEEQLEWAKTVNLSEPVEITVFLDGMFAHGDGHHRVMAAKLLGKDIPIIITYNHMKNKSEEGVWERWLELVQSGNNPKDLNPEQYNIKTMDTLDEILGSLDSAKNNLRRVLSIANAFLDELGEGEIDAVYLIGSRASGAADEESDWDYLVVGDGFDAVEEEKIARAEEGRPFSGLDIDVAVSERSKHLDIIFSENPPQADQKYIKVY